MILNKDSDTVFADHNDKRLTNFGRFIRISALDELPQFVMFLETCPLLVLVHIQSYLIRYTKKVQKFNKRHQFKPGITGLAQISGFGGKSIIMRICLPVSS